jgi:hypothetical protein
MIPKPGTILDNGATVISARKGRNGNVYVLCHWDKGGNPDGEYVSWRLFLNDTTEFGHYHEDFFEAVTRFKERLEK